MTDTAEILDVIDEENKIVGQASKEKAHAEGLRHRIAAVLLQAANGAFLVMSASALRGQPGLLRFSASGHVQSGESYIAAASRELREETGMVIGEKDLQPLGSFWLPPSQGSRDSNASTRWEIFLAHYNADMGTIVLNEEHEEDLWLGREELREIYKSKPERISPALLIALEKLLH